MNRSPALVECDRVTRRFGHDAAAVTAVRDATCRVAPGARIAIVGPSGSGKSTLVHLLAGLDRPSSGAITWPALGGDHPTLRPGPVVVVFQAPSLVPALDVVENVALPLLLAGVDETAARRRAGRALERLALTDIAGRLPEEISGGQAQRVATARALAVDPVLILADEPTGQLDSANAAVVIDALVDAADHSGAALAIATHDPGVARRMRESWRMRDGRLDVGLFAVPAGEHRC